MPNDVKYYPEDSLENMKRVAAEMAYPFPYLIDEIAVSFPGVWRCLYTGFFRLQQQAPIAIPGNA